MTMPMTKMIDCATCGGPMPADRRCCPHCHCKHSAWKKWAVAASTAALSACGGTSTAHPDLGSPDAAIHDALDVDQTIPEPQPEYGPAQIDFGLDASE